MRNGGCTCHTHRAIIKPIRNFLCVHRTTKGRLINLPEGCFRSIIEFRNVLLLRLRQMENNSKVDCKISHMPYTRIVLSARARCSTYELHRCRTVGTKLRSQRCDTICCDVSSLSLFLLWLFVVDVLFLFPFPFRFSLSLLLCPLAIAFLFICSWDPKCKTIKVYRVVNFVRLISINASTWRWHVH